MQQYQSREGRTVLNPFEKYITLSSNFPQNSQYLLEATTAYSKTSLVTDILWRTYREILMIHMSFAYFSQQ